jgi:hypothetical protein
MANLVNQHFVPMYYFRLFTGGRRSIHVLLKSNDTIIKNASIKGQCAHNRFYGPKNIEEIFSRLEANHSNALKYWIDLAWSSHPTSFEPKYLSNLWEAIIFQRARTDMEIKKVAPAWEAFHLEIFKEYLRNKESPEFFAEFVKEVKNGNIRITESPQSTVFRLIQTAIQSVLLVSDLYWCILRNHSDYPFIFSDAPVIFYNSYYRNVKDRGVLGLQTPGLQIFYPLNSETLVMMSDSQVYKGRALDNIIIDITERSDVSQLNALQLHHSANSVYFSDADDEEYVSSLWLAHKNRLVPPKTNFEIPQGWLVDGKPPNGILYHIFEPQLNIELDLSFVECTPIDPRDYKVRHRSPELVAEQKESIRKNEDKRHDTPNDKV